MYAALSCGPWAILLAVFLKSLNFGQACCKANYEKYYKNEGPSLKLYLQFKAEATYFSDFFRCADDRMPDGDNVPEFSSMIVPLSASRIQLPESEMQISSYTIPPTSDHPFFMTAKRYWLSECEEQEPESGGDAKTLILLHSTSYHKEIWEPFMQAFYRLLPKKNGTENRTKMGTIRDAWAIECPNHGESAYLNLRLWGSQKPHERVKCVCSNSFYIYLTP